jgi:hypothetical protein
MNRYTVEAWGSGYVVRQTNTDTLDGWVYPTRAEAYSAAQSYTEKAGLFEHMQGVPSPA